MRDDIVQPAWKHVEVHKRTGKELRSLLNTSVIFSMSAKTFVIYAFTNYGVVYTLEEATKIRTTYLNTYRDISKLHQYVWSNYEKANFRVYTALGRVVKPKLGTDGINIPVQGTGAETTKLAVHYLIKDNPDEPMIKYIYNVVHDAIYLRVPRNKRDKMVAALETAMLKGWTEISKCPLFKYKDIPMIADCQVIE